VHDRLYTLWNYVLQHLMYFLPPKIVCSWCNQIYSGFSAIKYILNFAQ
jgi:hypothetical protein